MESSRECRDKIEGYLREKKCGPITELPNRLTKNIDLCKSGREIVDLLHKTDQEIIDGWLLLENLNEETKSNLPAKTQGLKHDLVILDKLARLARLIRNRLEEENERKKPPLKIVISGCGTSGRIAYLCSRTFNVFVRRDVCEYTIAGGDWALVNSVESVEDKPDEGRKDLAKIMKEHPNAEIVYIGITCGLSAPYVAGQLSYCMDQLEQNDHSRVLACALIGFNPIDVARRTQPINSRNETFADLLVRMSSLEQLRADSFFILNPLVGPEPVTGSSRMKSGTTTKMMLDIVLSLAVDASSCLSDQTTTVGEIVEMIDSYDRVANEIVYGESESIGEIIDRAAESLRASGSVNYLLDDERLGFLACVDASECVPTYGANKDDIKGFVAANASSDSLSSQLDGCELWRGFLRTCHTVQSRNILENLAKFTTPTNLFVVIDCDKTRTRVANKSIQTIPTSDKILAKLNEQSNSRPRIACVSLITNENGEKEDESKENVSSTTRLTLNKAGRVNNEYFAQCLEEFALKLVLNAISTGAHVLIGKTYENIMVDVRVSNIKLFYRALGILRRLSGGRSERECEECLLKSIYGDELNYESIDRSDIPRHIERATGQAWVVPRALVMLLAQCSAQKARDYLSLSGNSVRNCIFKLKNNNNNNS